MRTLTSLKIALFSLGVLAASLVAPVAAHAEPVSAVTIDIQKILNESTAAKAAKKQIDAKRDEYQKELKTLETTLQKEQQSIQDQRSVLSQEALNQKAKEFEGKMIDAQKNQKDKRDRLAYANEQVLSSINAALTKIVPTIAASKNAKLVIPTAALFYATPDLDITPDVLAQLNKDLPSVKVNFTLPTAPAAAKQ